MSAPPKPSLSSLIDLHPAHVNLIGQLTVEFNTLDVICGWLFSFVTNIDSNLAHVIFHTPRAYYQRVELLENAISNQFEEGSDPHRQAKALTARYRKIVDKRHKLIHDTWGTDDSGKPVRRSLPYLVKHELTPIEDAELSRLLDDVRTLGTEIYAILPAWSVPVPVPLSTRRKTWHER